MNRVRALWPICVAVLLMAIGAHAHQLYGIRVGRTSAVKIERSRVEVVYKIHVGDILAFSERRAMDENGDGEISGMEKRAYLDRMEDELRRGFVLRMDGDRLDLAPTARSDSLGEARIGPMSFEMQFEFRTEERTPDGGEHELAFTDRNYSDDPVDPEMVLRINSGVKILDSSDRWDSERYPFDPWASLEERRTLKVLFRAGSGGASASSFETRSVLTERPVMKPGMKDRLKEILERPNLPPHFIFFAFLISILLGAMHAVEPGHGKTIVAAYLIGSRGTVWNAIFLGAIVTITHTFSIIVLGLLTLFASKYVVPQKLFPWLGFISGVFIIGVGIWLLFRYLRGAHGHGHSHGTFGHAHDHETSHSHTHDETPEHTHDHGDSQTPEIERSASWVSLLSLGISGGLVPCPAALVILLTAVALNRILFGLALIVSFSLGLAVVLITIGILMVVARSAINRFTGEGRIIQMLPLVSAVFIIVLGFGIAIKALIDGGMLVINL